MLFSSRIRCQDLDPRPVEHESSPITTRPPAQNHSKVSITTMSKTVSVRSTSSGGSGSPSPSSPTTTTSLSSSLSAAKFLFALPSLCECQIIKFWTYWAELFAAEVVALVRRNKERQNESLWLKGAIYTTLGNKKRPGCTFTEVAISVWRTFFKSLSGLFFSIFAIRPQ